MKQALLDKTKKLEDSQTLLTGMRKELKDTKYKLEAFHLAIGWENGDHSALVVPPLVNLAMTLIATRSSGVREIEQLAI
jgi:hypothetical protein